jgi:hypothetical protein
MKWVVNTLTSWDEAPRARHQVTNELVKSGDEVFFVERNKFGFFKVKQRKEKKDTHIITPYFPVGFQLRYRVPLINEFYQLWLFKKIRKITGQVPVINFDFSAHLLNLFFNRRIYYCNDEYIGNSKFSNFLINLYHKVCEKRVIKTSGFCISTSGYLTNKLLKYNSHVHEIQLGGPDLSGFHFKNLKNPEKGIHVGFVGFIDERNISDTILNKLVNDESVQITLVGPADKDFVKRIGHPEKIKFTGTLINEDLYNIISTFDVAIAPYNLKKKNPGATPNKLLHYLACGKPVVINELPNIKNMNFPTRSVYVAKSENDFLTLVYLAVKENTREAETERRKYASENTWGKRIEKFKRIADDYGLTSEEPLFEGQKLKTGVSVS